MRRRIIRVTLALSMLVTAPHLAPQHVRAEEATPFNLEKAMMEARTPAQHETMASYYDRAAATARTKATEARRLAEVYRDLAMTGRSQFQIGGHYWQLAQYYERLAADNASRAEAHRQLAQAVAHKSQYEDLLVLGSAK